MQPVIIDGQVAKDFWLSAIDEQSPPETGRIATLAQWQLDTCLPAVILQTDDNPETLFDHLEQLALIAVHFPDMNDGRGFSMGRALREAGFKGELRATGRYIRDQLQYLKRCGFNAFSLPSGTTPAAALESLNEINIHYQAAQDLTEPLFKPLG